MNPPERRPKSGDTVTLKTRVTPAEADTIRAHAQAAGYSTSKWIAETVLDQITEPSER